MKLLVTTQAVDKDDPILGFFHGWLLEFSKHFERIDVICLKEGKHTLPQNVTIHSLGKESGENRLKYLFRFFRYVWRPRNDFDVVFSHMNPHYILCAGWFWSCMGKKMFFWRNHAEMNLKTRIAAFFATRVFYTSPYACTRVFAHSEQMSVGIDTELFRPQDGVVRESGTILFLGRLSPVKRPELFAEASTLLLPLRTHVYGDDPNGSKEYQRTLGELSNGTLIFHESVPNYKTPAIYSAHDVYVNLTPEGSMDKTVLEAAACGALVLVHNRSFASLVPAICMLNDLSPDGIARAVNALVTLPEAEKDRYRAELQDMVQREHSLKKLAQRLKEIFTGFKKRTK